MCDYCGCRREGPTGELAREHVRLLELSEIIEHAIDADEDVSATFADFVDLLQRHATKEEIGLFEHARAPLLSVTASTHCASNTRPSTGGWRTAQRAHG